MNSKLPWLIVLLLLALPAAAQQPLISIRVSAQPVSFVIDELNRQYGLQFAYSTSQVDLGQRVSADIRNAPAGQALKKIFEGTGIDFTLSGRNVILFPGLNYHITISGYLREKGTGELLIGAVVNTEPLIAGSATNAYGFYSITLPADTYTIRFHYTGYKSVSVKLGTLRSQQINAELEPSTNLNEVVINSETDQKSFKLNGIEVPILGIKSIPMVLGEKDVVKYIMLSPGVQKGNEGNSYMYVRGGGPDQNLVLIDDAVIYNAYHFLGLSSLFSGSELRRAELIKGGFSAKYGGRLSSVLDMSMKDGNREKLGVDATLGLISSRVMVEGPLIRNKASFLISARKSYIAEVSRAFTKENSDLGFLNYNFYDLHAKLSADLGRKDRLMVSGYLGKDRFLTPAEPDMQDLEDGISWGNRVVSLRWNHEISNKLFLNTSAVYSGYKTRSAYISSNSSGEFVSNVIQSDINDATLKADVDYLPGARHKLKGGAGVTRHLFTEYTVASNYLADSATRKKDHIYANECYAYGEWTWTPTERIRAVSGLRYSFYRSSASYNRLEPRVNLGYSTPTNWSFQATYALMNQYMHLLSSFSGFGIPNDVWVSSDKNLAPQRSHLVTLGVSKSNLFKRAFTVNVELYEKTIENVVAFREGYSFLNILFNLPGTQVNNWSQMTTQGTGRSRGAELLVKKEHKRFEAWISYTLSRTRFRFDEINRGAAYSPYFDRTHDFGAFTSINASKHFKFSAYWVYGTGNAVSLPTGSYSTITHTPGQGFNIIEVPDMESKNSFRMRAYHRLDLSIQYLHTIGQSIQSTIELSVYNTYNRANPFFYELGKSTGGSASKLTMSQVSLFPVIPALSWSLKF